ncbi:MAG: DUF5050 domain-containing protein [Butyrivibrio sp.]
MKKGKKILIIVIILLAVTGLGLAGYFSRRIPKNPAGATGNTAGNLLNGGNFCELNGRIYFSNPYDNGKLYSMNSDCSNVKKLSDDTAQSINAYGKFLYYIRNNSTTVNNGNGLFRGEVYAVMRCKTNGKSAFVLESGYATDLSLSGSTLVYNTVNNGKDLTCTVGIDGSNPVTISETNIENGCIVDNYIYYSSSLQSHGIYTMSVSDGISSQYLDGNTYLPSRVDDILYYIDLDNDYALTKVDLISNTRSVISNDRVILYNVYDDVIFYQTENDVHEFVRIKNDGSNRTVVLRGDITSVSCTSEYTFFQLFGSDTLYRVSTKGLPMTETFFPQ